MTASELFLYFLRCELNGQEPGPVSISEETLTELLALSRKHSLTAVVAYALESAGISDPRFREEKYRAIYRNAQLLSAGEQVCAFLEQSGIRHMPLKGMRLQELYPKPGMRQMSDCDIFYDESAQETVKDWLLANGYSIRSYDKGYHDSYQKLPVANIEMHRVLLDLIFDSGWLIDSDAVWKRAERCPGMACRYALTVEDELVYLTAHACKHLRNRGTGIRTLTDLYLYRRAHDGELDDRRILRKLEEVHLREMAEPLLRLSRRLLSPEGTQEALSAEDRELLAYLMGSGTFGSYSQAMQNWLRKLQPDGAEPGLGARLRYCLKRIHPERERLLRSHPYFRHHSPAMLPLFRVKRFFRAVFHPSRKLRKELRTLFRKS